MGIDSSFLGERNHAQRMITEAEKEKIELEKRVREEARIAALLQDKLRGQFEALSRGLKLSGRG